MLRITAICLAALIAGQAAADSCWRRDYDSRHMASHPQQTVQMLSIRLPDTVEGDGKAVAMFRGDQQSYDNALYCWPPQDELEVPKGGWACGVDCDGGSFIAVREGKDALLVTTRGGFVVGAACGIGETFRQVTDEGAAETTFKLHRDPAGCR